MAEPYTPRLARKVLIGLAEETTAGTLESITTASAVVFDNYSFEPGDFFSAGERESDRGELPAVAGERQGTCKFRMEMHYGGLIPSLLTACGYANATGYKPNRDMSTRKTWSVVAWEDGVKKALAGCAATCTIEVMAGNRAYATWEFTGIWQAPTDVSNPSKPSYSSLPWTASASTLTIGTAAIPYTDKVTINLGATVAKRPDVTATGGIRHFYVADIKPTIELNCESRTVAQRDVYGLLLAGTTAAFSLALTDGSNTLTLAAPAIQRRQVAPGEADNRRLDAETFRCCISAGNDELSVVAA